MRTPTALWFKWISEASKKPLTAFHMCQRLYHLLVFYHIHFFLSMSLYKIQILWFKSNYNTSWQAFNERFVFELLTESAVFFFLPYLLQVASLLYPCFLHFLQFLLMLSILFPDFAGSDGSHDILPISSVKIVSGSLWHLFV